MTKQISNILQEGITFHVNAKRKKRNPGFLGFFQKKKTLIEKQEFTIKELTLKTLELITEEKAILEATAMSFIDEKGNSVQSDTKVNHMAKIVSLAVTQNKREAERLHNFFKQNLKPSELQEIINVINLMSNFPDYVQAVLKITGIDVQQEKSSNHSPLTLGRN